MKVAVHEGGSMVVHEGGSTRGWQYMKVQYMRVAIHEGGST